MLSPITSPGRGSLVVALPPMGTWVRQHWQYRHRSDTTHRGGFKKAPYKGCNRPAIECAQWTHCSCASCRIALEWRCTCIALPHLIPPCAPTTRKTKIQPTVSAPTFDESGSPICPATCRACWPPCTSATAHPQVEVIGHAVSLPQLNLKPVTQRLKVSIPLRVESHPTLIFVDTAVR
jgi:hypothetical protein